MELNIVQGYFLNFEFNFIQNETQRSQVNHSGGYGVEAGSSPKPGKNHTPYFPAGPCEVKCCWHLLHPGAGFSWRKKKKKNPGFCGFFVLGFLCFFFAVFPILGLPSQWVQIGFANCWCSPFPFHHCLSLHLFLELGLYLHSTTGLCLRSTTTPIPPSTFT